MSPRETANFLERFVTVWTLEESCTIFNSLEVGLSKHGLVREMVECIFFGSAMSRRVMSSVCGDHGLIDPKESNVLQLLLKCCYEKSSISKDYIIYAKHNLLCSWGAVDLVR
jgi:hypothetical protein